MDSKQDENPPTLHAKRSLQKIYRFHIARSIMMGTTNFYSIIAARLLSEKQFAEVIKQNQLKVSKITLNFTRGIAYK